MSLSQTFLNPVTALQQLCRSPGYESKPVLTVARQYREALVAAQLPTRPLDAVIEILQPVTDEDIPPRIVAQAVAARLNRHSLFPRDDENLPDFFQRLEGLSQATKAFRTGLNLAWLPGRLFLKAEDLRGLTFRFRGEIPGYADPKEIARSHISRVYRATDPYEDETVALKVFQEFGSLRPADTWIVLNELRFQSDPESEDIVEALDTDRILRGPAFISYPWMSGGALVYEASGERAQSPDWPLEKILNIAHQMIALVARLHARRIIHRDIKPNNFLLDEKGQKLWITDFSVAIRREEARPTYVVPGTDGYMPPEVLEAFRSGDSSYEDYPSRDVFSLGQSLLEFFDWTLPERLKSPEEPRTPAENDLLRRLRHIIDRALEPDARRRYLDAGQMEREFARLL